MSTTIVTLQSSDLISNSRADLNSNFNSILNNKIETSVIDTDTALTANSDAALASQKAVKAYIDAQTLVTALITTAATTTLSLTTDGSQKVLVFAKGNNAMPSVGNVATITLLYNGVIKDTVAMTSPANTYNLAFALMYTETPAAGTHNITVAADVGTLANVTIIAVKI